MKKTFIIFRKELLETLRDRRTLVRMLLIPLLMYPIILMFFGKLTESQREKAQNMKIKIALYDQGNAPGLRQILAMDTNVVLKRIPGNVEEYIVSNEPIPDSIMQKHIKEGEYNMIIILGENFREQIEQGDAGEIKYYYSSTGNELVNQKVEQMLELYKEHVIEKRFAEAGLKRSFSEGIAIQEYDVASQQEQIGKYLGGILPYFFIIFCFMGSMYPAIDLAAGEKERGTIETILTTPASRLQILAGKIGVIILTGLASAAVSIIGIVVSLSFADFIPDEILDILYSMIEPSAVLLILLILLPLTIFFASFLISVSIYSRSFKEAQSSINPLIIVVILPAMVGFIPGIELDPITALIPILNVSLVTKQIISGNLDILLYLESFFSLLVLAGLSLAFAIHWFGRESTILR